MIFVLQYAIATNRENRHNQVLVLKFTRNVNWLAAKGDMKPAKMRVGEVRKGREEMNKRMMRCRGQCEGTMLENKPPYLKGCDHRVSY